MALLQRPTWKRTPGRMTYKMLVRVVSDLGEKSGAAVITCSEQTAGESGWCGSSLLCFSSLFLYIYMRKRALFISSQGKFGSFLCPLAEVTVDPPVTRSKTGWLLESNWELSRLG